MSGAPHPFEEVLAAGAKVVELIIGQSAAGGSDAIFAEVEKPSRAQVYAALIVMALVDRDLQRGPVRFDLEVPALDRLSMAAAEGLEPLRAAAVELDEAAARDALAQLLCLHAELTAARLQATAAAALN